jgi:hypothetical protein
MLVLFGLLAIWPTQFETSQVVPPGRTRVTVDRLVFLLTAGAWRLPTRQSHSFAGTSEWSRRCPSSCSP